MAVKKTLYCWHCRRQTLHEEISYSEAVAYAEANGEKNIFLKGFAIFADYYPFAKVLGRTIAGWEVAMQCSVCAFIRSLKDD